MVAEQPVLAIHSSSAQNQGTTAQTCIRRTSRYQLLTEYSVFPHYSTMLSTALHTGIKFRESPSHFNISTSCSNTVSLFQAAPLWRPEETAARRRGILNTQEKGSRAELLRQVFREEFVLGQTDMPEQHRRITSLHFPYINHPDPRVRTPGRHAGPTPSYRTPSLSHSSTTGTGGRTASSLLALHLHNLQVWSRGKRALAHLVQRQEDTIKEPEWLKESGQTHEDWLQLSSTQLSAPPCFLSVYWLSPTTHQLLRLLGICHKCIYCRHLSPFLHQQPNKDQTSNYWLCQQIYTSQSCKLLLPLHIKIIKRYIQTLPVICTNCPALPARMATIPKQCMLPWV